MDVAGCVKLKLNAGSPTKFGGAYSMEVEDEIINYKGLSTRESVNPLNA